MCRIDLEPCEVFTETAVKANKRHICDCCHGVILPGKRYMKHFSRFDGEITTEKKCMRCNEMVEEFAKVHGQYGSPGSMPAMLQECIEADIDSGEMINARKWRNELTKMAKRAKRAQKSCS
jgi:hypothetical protein